MHGHHYADGLCVHPRICALRRRHGNPNAGWDKDEPETQAKRRVMGLRYIVADLSGSGDDLPVGCGALRCMPFVRSRRRTRRSSRKALSPRF